MSLPDPQIFYTLSKNELEFVLDNLFEPCRTLTDILISHIKKHKFNSYTQLIEYCKSILTELIEDYREHPSQSSRETICKIVSAHPRLGAPKTIVLSEHSQNEQKSLSGSEELTTKLKQLNEEYEKKFPGLIFVVFVNGRSREAIMKIMRDRIENSTWINEVEIAFNEMCDIALDRAKKLNAKL